MLGFPNNDFLQIMGYLIAQILGGICAGLTSWAMISNYERSACFSVYPPTLHTFSDAQIFFAEYMFTFLLVLVIINVNNVGNQYFGMTFNFFVLFIYCL